MATATVDRGMLWTDLEGRELPGGWRLKRLVRPEGRNAWFEAMGPDGKPAMVSLTETLNDEDELLERLRAAQAIRHPNVVQVRDARLAWISETPIVMAAMEATDENLADVLRERALESHEARLLFDSLLRGLAAIHAQRLVHGRMVAGSVLAMGETVKLRSDCLHVDGFATGASEDVRGVGRIMVQALTRRIPTDDGDPALQQVPEALRPAVRRALAGNATVEEVAALAGTRLSKPVEPVRASGDAKPAPQPIVMQPAGTTAAGKAATPQMDLPLLPRRRAEQESEDEEQADRREAWLSRAVGDAGTRLRKVLADLKDRRWNYHRRGAAWVIGAAVVLVIATALLLHGWMHRGPGQAAVAPAPRIVVARARPAKAAPVIAKAADPAKVWKVVAYTYRKRSEAEQRARDLGQRYPQFHAGVMATRGGDFLVTLGGAMTRDEAMALRARAVQAGLPRDTYAQKFG